MRDNAAHARVGELQIARMTFTSSIRLLRPEPVGATAIPGSPAQLETFIAQETEK